MNKDHPHGFEAFATQHGGPIATTPFTKLASYATKIFKGDSVMQNNAGDIIRFGTPGTDRLSGVAAHSSPASTLDTVLVYDDPSIIFEVQDDGAAGPTAGNGFQATERGLLANVAKGAGDSIRDISTDELDTASLAVTATLDLKVLGKVESEDNAYGANCRVMVLINKHRLNRETAGV